MARVKGGSLDAFEELYDRYCDRAYRVARSVCHNHWRAEDAVQEAFLAVWQRRASYLPERGTVAAWLLTTVRYRAIDAANSNRKHSDRRAEESALDDHPASGDVIALAIAHDEASRLAALLAELPDAQQEVIALAFYGGLTHAEIATTLQLPPGTIKGRMRLGLQKLRMNIDREAA